MPCRQECLKQSRWLSESAELLTLQIFGSQWTLSCHKEHHHVEPEFVVFFVVRRELCDLASSIPWKRPDNYRDQLSYLVVEVENNGFEPMTSSMPWKRSSQLS